MERVAAALVVVLLGCQSPAPRMKDAAPLPDAAVDAAPAAIVIPPMPAAARGPAFADFVGAEVCAECHADKHSAWVESTHGKAGGAPSPDVVVSHFSGTLEFADATVKLAVEDGQYQFRVTHGGETQTLTVDALVGGGHMLGGGTQTAFTRGSDGSLQLIPFDYSKTDDVWFCEASGDRGWVPISKKLKLADCTYWPPRSNFGPICGNCHASQMQASYDPATRRETVRFKDLRINCESCHGPGRRHVELARAPGFGASADIGLESLSLLDTEAMNGVCFRCHAVTQPLAPGYLPGGPFEDHYGLAFHVRDKHHPDGRIKGFGYQEGHLWSDCYLNGSMTCVDCHAPHTGGYRDRQGRALTGKLADGQCTGCHPSKGAAHSHHEDVRCVACHMPFLQHTDLGRTVKFTRSDHVISIPRPALDAKLGLETACAGSHEQDAAWAQAAVDRWYGPLKPRPAIVEDVTVLQAGQDQKAMTAAFVAERPAHAMAEFEKLRAGLANLGYMSEAVIARIEAFAKHPSVEVRAQALAYLHEAAPHLPRLNAVITQALAEDTAPVALRRRWALWLTLRARKYMGRGGLKQALEALTKAVAIDPGSREAAETLAQAYRNNGQDRAALEESLRLLGLKPRTQRDHNRLLEQICALQLKVSGTLADDLCAGGRPR